MLFCAKAPKKGSAPSRRNSCSNALCLAVDCFQLTANSCPPCSISNTLCTVARVTSSAVSASSDMNHEAQVRAEALCSRSKFVTVMMDSGTFLLKMHPDTYTTRYNGCVLVLLHRMGLTSAITSRRLRYKPQSACHITKAVPEQMVLMNGTCLAHTIKLAACRCAEHGWKRPR